eukprot:10576735-Alexandrium_andersonii.AAC.1
MSASLVGSEMCIRDSPSCPRGGQMGGGGVHCSAMRSGPLPNEEEPVSYTHLTQPTRCSV